jgi:hypothetical protein
MRMIGWPAAAALAAMFSTGIVHASGPVSVYALIDKVTLITHKQPGDNRAMVRIDGVFSVSETQNGSSYSAPQRGYLFLSGDMPELGRESADLQSVAGTRQVVAFGASWMQTVRVRKPSEPQSGADTFPVGNGVIKLNADQPRARALLDYKEH